MMYFMIMLSDPSIITPLLMDYNIYLNDHYYYALLEKVVNFSTPMDVIAYINERIAEDSNSMVEDNNVGHPSTSNHDFNEAPCRANANSI